jgi:RimJ/RimL family protein N-acetyltransferase
VASDPPDPGRGGELMSNRIDTERLSLWQLEVEEARALLQGRPDPRRPWVVDYPIQGTLVAVEAFLRAVDNGVGPGPYGVYQLVRTTDGRVIGDIGFHGPPDRDGAVTVGYGLAASARGHGYATEALRALAAWALAQPEVERVEADTTHANLPSQRVMERVGMRLVDRNEQLRFYRLP